ncbi:MAG: hypothetical protein IPO05_08545 [Flavobacteriales bacterium]|nr:hypothetical protein [Flavobacteriales bacterium]
MKNILLSSSIVLLATFSLSAQVTVDWNVLEVGLSIALDQQNNVFTVNYDGNLGGDITLTKRSSTGALLWTAAYDQTSTTRTDRATWVATDLQGNAIVTGTITSGFSNPVNANSLVEKFSPTGQLLWRVVYENDFDGSSTRKCVVDRAGFIYVLGIGTGPNGQVTKVKKFSPAGVPVWDWFDVGIGGPINIKFTPDSALVIAHRGVTGSVNGYTKLTRNGATIWNYTANSITVGDLAGDALGNTYLVHTAYPSSSSSIIRKVSPSGTLIWQNSYPITAYRVEVGSDNAPVISGFPSGGSGGAAFLKADASGTQLWVNNNVDGPENYLLHAQMMMDASNNAYLCAGTLFAMGICKVNSDGSTGWFITTPSSYSNGFVLGSDQAVYVTGGGTARLAQQVPGVLVAPSVFLEGPFVSATELMNDGLRAAGLLPLADPYPALGYVHVGPPSPSISAGVLSTTGPNAIVDHVLLELRAANNNAQLVASRTALVQRDGDVVDMDGTSPVTFTVPAASYFVAVSHRNHLSCMTAAAVPLGGNSTPVDFTSTSTLTYGTDARKAVGSVQVIWAGDVTFNDQVKYAGANNDRDPILARIGGSVPTNTANGYYTEDVNMDGVVKYAGVDNDRDPILLTIGGVVPTAVRNAQLP